jgi:transposase
MTDRKPYRSDLSDVQWGVIEPTLTAWRAPRLARKVSDNQPVHDLREIVNAILCVNRTGCDWEYLPHARACLESGSCGWAEASHPDD